MPRRKKRSSQLADNANKAREGINIPRMETPTSLDSVSEPIRARSMSTPTDEDPTFDPEVEKEANPVLKLEEFIEEWVSALDREDKMSLGLFLTYNLEYTLNFTATKSAEYAALMMGRSDRTIRQWRSDFMINGEILDNKQGTYQRKGLLWSSEELNKKASKFVRENVNIKGQPNLTSGSFCSWINECLLPNSCLVPGYPRKVSIETARQWLHHLGFEVLSATKGAYFDGHEREDVIASRKDFLKDMVIKGFLHPDQAPTPTAQQAFPSDVPLASSEMRDKLVVIFHDESTFNANDDQAFQWGKACYAPKVRDQVL